MTPILYSHLLKDEAATLRLGVFLSNWIKAGACIALSGALAAGKSTLARALIRNHLNDDQLAVPSPTFTLMQHYERKDLTLIHADCYRLSHAEEAYDIGLFDDIEHQAALIEWPELIMPAIKHEFKTLLWLSLTADERNQDGRILSIHACPDAFQPLLKEFINDQD